MSFLRSNIAVIAVFLLTAAYEWLFGGMRPDVNLKVIPWLWFFVFEAMLFFPQRRKDENSYSARERLWEDLRRDPLLWLSVAFLGLMGIAFANQGLCPMCDAAAIANGENPAPDVGFLPFCVNAADHLSVFLWFGPALTAMLAVKHALNRDGKVLLLQMLVVNGALIAVLGFVQQLCDAPGPLWQPLRGTYIAGSYFFATFGYPNMAGDMFTTLFCLALGLWRYQIELCNRELALQKTRRISKHRLFWLKHRNLIPAAILLLAVVATLSRACILLASAAAVLLLTHAAVSFMHKLKKAERVRTGAYIGGAAILAAVAIMAFMPDNVNSEMKSVNADELLVRMTGKGDYHPRIAIQLWREHKLFGCGGEGYQHFCYSRMTEQEKKNLWPVGNANVHNDFLQLLAEHGAVGAGLLIAILSILFMPAAKTWRALAQTARFAPPSRQPPQPHSLFAFPAGAFSVVVAAVCTLLHSLGDCPMRSPAIISLFFVEIAAIEGFLPHIDFRKDKDR